ncbi:hypothetical protein [Rhodococcus sp. HNM0569]|uniref:hypothetical protein n=1 Tax=Rhodococcus sp. HNM0569 TaxID=2716340 RepID=UPI00146B0959|nr:hypothetical protein [Rhodococcus sp. HNM0569]NLU82631.1 hypothetical protein [Rhodococcus sp. HNM0569]
MFERFSAAARSAVVQAQSEARETELDAVRDSIDETFGADALDRATPEASRGWFSRRTGHVPFTGAAKKALQLSLRETLARKEKTIEPEHILLGLLRAGDRSVVALDEPHLSVDDLRHRVTALLDRSA